MNTRLLDDLSKGLDGQPSNKSAARGFLPGARRRGDAAWSPGSSQI